MGVDFLSKEVDMKQKTICFYFWGSLETESNFIEVVLINVKELWEILEESYWCYLITKSCPALCKPTDYSTPGFPALHYLPEFAQIHVHWVVMPSNHLILCCPLLLPSIFPSMKVFANESAQSLCYVSEICLFQCLCQWNYKQWL